MRHLFLAVLLLSLIACASNQVKLGDFSSTTQFDDPLVGELVRRGVGEVIVSKGTRTVVPAIEIAKPTVFNKSEGEKSLMTCALTVQPGTYPKRGTYLEDPAGVDCFGPVTIQQTQSDGLINWNCSGSTWIADICRLASGNYFLAAMNTKAELKQQFDQIRPIEMLVEQEPNLVRELLYNGRAGSTIGFTYREFTDRVSKPSFVQELKYDLTESNVVNFRALRLEVVDASSNSISYRITAGF